jgi:hypothetical protein
VLRISFRGQSYVDGQEVPLRIVFDVENEAELRKQVEKVVFNFLEEMDFGKVPASIIGTLEMEVMHLWQVQ